MECLIKAKQRKFHLIDGDIVSHLKRKWKCCLSLMNCCTQHLWRCLQASPRLNLMLCWFAHWEMFCPGALYSRNAWWQPGKPSWDWGCWGCVQSCSPALLCRIFLLKKSGNNFYLETNRSQDHAALIMAFLKTARKISKIEVLRRKESGKNKEIAESVSELGCTSEGTLTMVHLHFWAAGYPKESSVLVNGSQGVKY